MELEKKMSKWLKTHGCVVFIVDNGLLFLKEGFWGFIELKKSKTAKRRPGQKEFIEKMGTWSWARVVYPEIWGELQKELEQLLK